MLFPPPPQGFRYFKAKNSQGVLAKFCAECGSHLDAHAYQWLTGGHGTVRACPPEDQIAPSSHGSSGLQTPGMNQQQQQQQPSSRSILATGGIQQNQQQQQQQSQQRFGGRPTTPNATTTTYNSLRERPTSSTYGSHHLYKDEADVDLSLTSSGLVGDKKTVGNVPAHHRFYGNAIKRQQEERRIVAEQREANNNSHSTIYPRSESGMPTPIPGQHHERGECICEDQQHQHHQLQQQQQQQQEYQDEESFYLQQQQQQQQQQGGGVNKNNNNVPVTYDQHFSSQQPGGRNFQLYDEAYSTPIPYGTEIDMTHPPQVQGPKGKRHIDRTFMNSTNDAHSAAPKVRGDRQLKDKMEKSNMLGAGGLCSSQDSVRPQEAIPKTKVTQYRKDAVSNMAGAGGVWQQN